MKKVFLALMAVAAIALTGCKDNGNGPDQKKQEEQKEKSPYIYAFYMPQQVINCTKFFIDEGDGAGEHSFDASKWTGFNKDSEEGKQLVKTFSDNPKIDWASTRQYVIYDTKPRSIHFTKAEVDSTNIPQAAFYGITGKFCFDPSTTIGGASVADYTYNEAQPLLNLGDIKSFANKIVGPFK